MARPARGPGRGRARPRGPGQTVLGAEASDRVPDVAGSVPSGAIRAAWGLVPRVDRGCVGSGIVARRWNQGWSVPPGRRWRGDCLGRRRSSGGSHTKPTVCPEAVGPVCRDASETSRLRPLHGPLSVGLRCVRSPTGADRAGSVHFARVPTPALGRTAPARTQGPHAPRRTARSGALPPRRVPHRPGGCLTAPAGASPPRRGPHRPGRCPPRGRAHRFPVRRRRSPPICDAPASRDTDLRCACDGKPSAAQHKSSKTVRRGSRAVPDRPRPARIGPRPPSHRERRGRSPEWVRFPLTVRDEGRPSTCGRHRQADSCQGNAPGPQGAAPGRTSPWGRAKDARATRSNTIASGSSPRGDSAQPTTRPRSITALGLPRTARSSRGSSG